MPRLANTTEKTVATPEKVESKTEVETKSTVDYDTLVKENQDLKAKFEMLLDKFSQMESQANTVASTQETSADYTKSVEPVKNEEEFVEPSPSKQIKVMSLYYGRALSLPTEINGSPKLVFNKFGQIKPVLYSTLVDIVNANRKFVDNGLFYILDKNAVYFLGLSDVYAEILNPEIITNICDYNNSDIDSILDNVSSAQKDTIAYNLRMKCYNNEKVDLNKIDFIGRKLGVNIISQVNEMKQFNDID